MVGVHRKLFRGFLSKFTVNSAGGISIRQGDLDCKHICAGNADRWCNYCPSQLTIKELHRCLGQENVMTNTDEETTGIQILSE